jgi:hypothetical protein
MSPTAEKPTGSYRPTSRVARGRRFQWGLSAGRCGTVTALNRRARNWETNQTPSSRRYDMRIQGRIVPPTSPPNIMLKPRPIGAPATAARPKRLAPTNVPIASPPIRPISVPRMEQTIMPPMAPAMIPTLPIPPTIAPSRSQTAIMLQTRLPIEAWLTRLFMETTTTRRDRVVRQCAITVADYTLNSRSDRERAGIHFFSEVCSPQVIIGRVQTDDESSIWKIQAYGVPLERGDRVGFADVDVEEAID